MAEKTPEQEPSIEEILASIRQIISDDDDAASGAADNKAAAAAAPVAEPDPEPEFEPEEEEEDEDVLELTEAEAIPVAVEPQPVAVPEEPIKVALQEIEETEEEDAPIMPDPAPSEESILSASTRQAAISSMAKLASSTPINRPNHNAGSVTLEDIVREILHPMLRDWMDNNLPPMVERIVQKELEKLARQALDE